MRLRVERGGRELNVESGNCVGLPGLGLGHRRSQWSSSVLEYDMVYTKARIYSWPIWRDLKKVLLAQVAGLTY